MLYQYLLYWSANLVYLYWKMYLAVPKTEEKKQDQIRLQVALTDAYTLHPVVPVIAIAVLSWFVIPIRIAALLGFKIKTK